jgi:hypothetical protein
MPKRPIDRLDLAARLAEGEETGAAIDWPVALHHRVDQLVELAEGVGERTSRKELVAAVVLAAPEEPERLSEMVRTYRTAFTRDALLNVPAGENVIELRRRGPGPRSKKKSQ